MLLQNGPTCRTRGTQYDDVALRHREIGDRIGLGRDRMGIIDKLIGIRPASERVVARSTREDIGTDAPVEDVVTRSAVQNVVAGSTRQGIVRRVTGDCVVSDRTDDVFDIADRVDEAGSPIDIDPIVPIERHGERAAPHGVVDRVRTGATVEDCRRRAEDDGIVAGGAVHCDRVGAVGPGIEGP